MNHIKMNFKNYNECNNEYLCRAGIWRERKEGMEAAAIHYV
jgi:hypothetical protein